MPATDTDGLVDAAAGGDRAALARLLSVIERGGPPARAAGRRAHTLGGGAYTVGITGAPGAGKSTLVDRLIGAARADGEPVAVLAVDPSSPFSGGAILGDRIRMASHFLDPGVFIRSMASRGHLGGLAMAAPEAIRVLDAAGFPWILVETVGVGQVEVEIAAAADTTVVVVNPGWGDAVQANKAGLLEIADVLVVNKADRPGAAETERDLQAMLDLSDRGPGGWRPPVVRTDALSGDGVDRLWEAVASHRRSISGDGTLAARRRRRVEAELREIVVHRLQEQVAARCAGPAFAALADAVLARRLDPHAAAERILEDGHGS